MRDNLDYKNKTLHALVQKSGAIYNWHNVPMTFLEAALTGGDRRPAPVILRAWQRGVALTAELSTFDFSLGIEYP